MNDIDFNSDDSFHKYVWPDNRFNNIEYKPSSLVLLEWEHIVDVVHIILNEWRRSINSEVLKPINDLWNAFFQKFWMNMYIQSAYRDFCRQYTVLTSVTENKKDYVALPWHSEHQTWFALDVINAQSDRTDYDEYFSWLAINAHKYWFHLSYQKWVEIDWYPKENWHIRYLWKDLSTYLKKRNMTFTEFYHKEKD